jgi:putative salt-induced outer membrane protein
MMKANLAAIVVAAIAAVTSAPAKAEWTGKGEVGIVFARGNTDTDTANVKLDLAHERERWKHALFIGALRTAEDGEETAERYEARWQSDYKFSERNFWFGALRYEDDQFSGFAYQASASTGIGHKFIDTDSTKLTGQAGLGYRRLELDTTGEVQSDPIVRGDLAFEHAFNASTKIIDKFLVESGGDNTYLQNDLALEVKMTDVLALALGYQVRHNTDPPPPLEKTDTLMTVNLVYSF